MKGLDYSRLFFEQYGRKMIEEKFPEYSGKIAAGLIGQGSDRYGFDDEHSRDHDFCVGFYLFLSKEDEEKIGFELMSEYRKLPCEFMGLPTREKEKCGASRYGVISYDDFFVPLVGKNYRNFTEQDFLYIPQNYLADATNGEIFYDGNGAFTEIYNSLKFGMPKDIRLKRMSANLAGMAQSGQYNYARTLLHGEEGAAVMALCRFVNYACSFIYLANGRYCPFYKWMIKGLQELPLFGQLAPSLDFLLTGDNDTSTRVTKSEIAEGICGEIADWLKNEGYSNAENSFLEEHAIQMVGKIKDSNIRNMHLFTGAEA